MAIIGYNESSLTTSEIFNGKNNDGVNYSGKKGETQLQKAINLIKTAKHLTNEDIEAAYIQVRMITDSLTREAIKAFDEGRTVLIYNNVQSLSVTQALPFITLKTPKGYVTYVFVDKYISINRDGVMNMQAPILRDLLIGALISNGLKTNYEVLATSPYLQKTLMELYTKFVTRILNRQSAIAADKIAFDTVQYWINKFFLTRIYGANNTPENIEAMSSAHFKYIDELKLEDIKRQYNEANPNVFSDLLELVKTASPRMKALNISTFLSDWIVYYYVASALAIDNVEYLIFMIMTLLSGNNIISIAASDIVKENRNIKNIRGELLKLI